MSKASQNKVKDNTELTHAKEAVQLLTSKLLVREKELERLKEVNENLLKAVEYERSRTAALEAVIERKDSIIENVLLRLADLPVPRQTAVQEAPAVAEKPRPEMPKESFESIMADIAGTGGDGKRGNEVEIPDEKGY